VFIRIIKYEKETTNKGDEMSEQEKEVRFENAVNRLDERFMANEMNQEDYDFLYEQLKKKFELV
jgi:uncharacterized membrane protein